MRAELTDIRFARLSAFKAQLDQIRSLPTA